MTQGQDSYSQKTQEGKGEHAHELKTKAHTGIDGFDHSTRGGLPCGRTTLLLGRPGSGKTVFALQTLVNGARYWGEPGIFVAFEENSEQIFANAGSFGWDLPGLEQQKLFFLDARIALDVVPAGRFDLSGMLASLKAKADEMGAKRVVFDSIDVLLTMLNDSTLERREAYRIHDWLLETGLTGVVTARLEVVNPCGSERYGFMQFMADCVVMLDHRVDDAISLRSVRTLKYRGSEFSENELPMVIGATGIEVDVMDPPGVGYQVSTERISTGVPMLDDMLRGGLYRGSSTLITGSPGTAKSTLCGAFVEAACQRGEKALYVSFDEAGEEIVRNMASVNIRLQPYVESGLLYLHSVRTAARSADRHLMNLRTMIDGFQPLCVAVDPLSAVLKAGGALPASSMAERLLGLAKSRGITLLFTSLLAGDTPEKEATAMSISTIADTWIHLSYVSKNGERNRALSIVKSRGVAHSNQVRELILSDRGISLADVYTAGGEVLFGTLRWEKEKEMTVARLKREADLVRKKKELALAEAEAQSRLQAIQWEIDSLRYEVDELNRETLAFESVQNERQETIRSLRDFNRQARSAQNERPAPGESRSGSEEEAV
ncbi:MAG: circadian clock protein KaiC [Chloroflexota bacterium]